MQNFDVIVVGAGPAGAIASNYLSKKGLTVGLLEKNDLGRDKICGGGISQYSLDELPFSLPLKIIEQKIKGLNFISPENDIFQKKESNQIGITVYRDVFDSFLVEKAINAGVTFIPNFKVKKVTESNNSYIFHNTYSAKYVIGADGVNSVIRKIFQLGKNKRPLNLGVRALIPLEEDQVTNFMIDRETFEFYFNNHQAGYGWIFALKYAINIGIGTKINNPYSRQLLRDFIKRSFKLRNMKVPTYKIQGFPIPNSKLPRQFSKNHVFLIGDAAGIVDPVSGEGVHYAIRSAKIVADTIIKDIYCTLPEKIDSFYSKRIKYDIGSDLFVSYRLNLFLERFFLHNMHFWFKMLHRNPFIFTYAPEIAMKSNYYQVYKDVLKKLPKITMNTLLPRIVIPGYQYKNYEENNYIFG